jgi:hypothetical protein
MKLFITGDGAEFSHDRKHRYRLWRQLCPVPLPVACLIMCNSSDGDEDNNDPTIRISSNAFRSFGFGKMVVLNLFARVSSNPAELAVCEQPVGLLNDRILFQEAAEASMVVCAWGLTEYTRQRAAYVVGELLEMKLDLYAFGIAKDGTPYHPMHYARSGKALPMPTIWQDWQTRAGGTA